MTVGISYIGIIWLIALFAPNIAYIKNRPAGIERLKPEDRILKILERIGEVGVTMIAPISKNLNPSGLEPRLVILALSAACMALYEVWWIRYFLGEKTLKEFYSSLLKIPVPGAALPAAAFGLLAIYGRSPQLMLFVIPLGIGHIKIHLNHKKELSEIGEE